MNQEKNIFVVEDDVFLASVLVPHIKKRNINVDLFSKGEDVMEAFKTKTPELLVLDLYLPSMSGLEVLEAIRKDPKLETLQVLVFSNTDNQKDKTRVQELGAEFILKAMMTPNEVAKHIEEILDVIEAKK